MFSNTNDLPTSILLIANVAVSFHNASKSYRVSIIAGNISGLLAERVSLAMKSISERLFNALAFGFSFLFNGNLFPNAFIFIILSFSFFDTKYCFTVLARLRESASLYL